MFPVQKRKQDRKKNEQHRIHSHLKIQFPYFILNSVLLLYISTNGSIMSLLYTQTRFKYEITKTPKRNFLFFFFLVVPNSTYHHIVDGCCLTKAIAIFSSRFSSLLCRCSITSFNKTPLHVMFYISCVVYV